MTSPESYRAGRPAEETGGVDPGEEAATLPGDVALSIRGISKKFCRHLRRSMAYGIEDLVRNLTGIRPRSNDLRRDEFWALRDVNLDVKKGETLGIIGSNGSGKSTLLRVASGIFPPDAGSVVFRGRIGALIALGAGFHPHLSGRENVFLNGTILGMTHEEIRQKFSDILEFAEIGPFIDAPASTYSSGMRVRLGFSVAIHMRPDVLLVDEVLSVGDASFRARCYSFISDFRDRGGSVVFISHNTVAVERVCDRVVWLERGCVQQVGEPSAVVESYENAMLVSSQESEKRLHGAEEKSPASALTLPRVDILNADGEETDVIHPDQSLKVRIMYHANTSIKNPYFIVAFQKSGISRDLVAVVSMLHDNVQFNAEPGEGVVECDVGPLPFTPGNYSVHVGVLATPTGKIGEKWHSPIRPRAVVRISHDSMRSTLSGSPAAHLVSQLPPIVLSHEWSMGKAAGCPNTSSE